MYSKRANLIIGFHGCDESIRDRLVNSKSAFKKSENDYDWLGHGMYFWDNDPERALEFAVFKKTHIQSSKSPITKPSVVGALINPGLCLDLINSKSPHLLKSAFSIFKSEMERNDYELPKNKPLKTGKDLVLRNLDCAVIETLHLTRIENKLPSFDTVRGVFWEGNDLYDNAGFKEKNHIQVCVRNPNCIKGFFIPRESDNDFDIP
ncbi:MAG: hypothetical protein ABI723_06650 [Bacteroidia bacterium]